MVAACVINWVNYPLKTSYNKEPMCFPFGVGFESLVDITTNRPLCTDEDEKAGLARNDGQNQIPMG